MATANCENHWLQFLVSSSATAGAIQMREGARFDKLVLIMLVYCHPHQRLVMVTTTASRSSLIINCYGCTSSRNGTDMVLVTLETESAHILWGSRVLL